MKQLGSMLAALFLIISCGRDHETYPNDKAELNSIRDQLREWAHTCDGRPAQNTAYKGRKGCGIGDANLYQGMGCLAGEKRYCIRPPLSENDSRDMTLGAIAYIAATKDKEYIIEAKNHFAKLPKKVCLDACDRTPLIQDLMYRSGISNGGKLAESVIESTLYTASLTAPVGYQLRLIADEVVVYKALGVSLSRNIAKNLYRRQSCNPYFRYLAYGSYNLYHVNTKPNNVKTHWLFSDACSEQFPNKSNGNMELFLVNLTINGWF